jgi:hypothetical protein
MQIHNNSALSPTELIVAVKIVIAFPERLTSDEFWIALRRAKLVQVKCGIRRCLGI